MVPNITAVADSWSALYAGSAVLRTAVSFAHVGGLVAGGGFAIAADRATLLSYRSDRGERARQLVALRRVHRVVLLGLAAVIVSGVLLALSDLDAYWSARVFWLKMGLVAALAVNGAVLTRAGRRAGAGDAAAWLVLRRTAILSLALWFATTLAGAALPNAL